MKIKYYCNLQQVVPQIHKTQCLTVNESKKYFTMFNVEKTLFSQKLQLHRSNTLELT